jgi:CBS domain-containing protein
MEEDVMATTIRDVMAPRPIAVPATATLTEVARQMRDADIGDVIVQDGNQVAGIVTDRDIVVRAIADDLAPGQVSVAEICSNDLVTVRPDDPVERAVQLMRGAAVRRLPVAEDGNVVGVVTLGDLALERDPASALADISSAEPNI